MLEFREPRASFASFAAKFVYRGIAAGPVPPVPPRRAGIHPLSLSRGSAFPRRSTDGGRTRVTRKGVENVEIRGGVHSRKKERSTITVDSRMTR